MMEPLLRHVVEITTHRDHGLLDLSVISALQALITPHSVRLLEIISLDGQLFLLPKVWRHDDLVASRDEETPLEQLLEPVSAISALQQCLTERRSMAEGSSAAGNAYLLWLPVWLNDKPIACVEMSSTTPFTSQMHAVAEGILCVYRNFQSLLDYSERDSLTGLFNRKTFDENFSKMVLYSDAKKSRKEAAGSEMERRELPDSEEQWLAVLDIDHFKRVNDEYGHLYGDEVLILLANLLKSSFRACDRIFRFGGEEFVILLRSVTQDNARMILERFRQQVADHPFPQVGRVTVSVGFVRLSGDAPVVILGRADQALYHAKSNGRNRICFYDDLLEQGILQHECSSSSVEFF